MKPIHKAVGKDDLRPGMLNFMVKGGFVWATNAHIAIKLPVSEVFGEEIADNEELYFSGKEWAKGKFEKADHFYRTGNTFKCNKNLNEITALTKDQTEHRFPDVEHFLSGIPYKELIPMTSISFQPQHMADVCAAFGDVNQKGFDFYFYGYCDDAIVVKNIESEGWGVIMPVNPSFGSSHPFKKA